MLRSLQRASRHRPTTLLAAGLMQAKNLEACISEQTCRLNRLLLSPAMAIVRGVSSQTARYRPFPVVVMIHGGLVTRPAEALQKVRDRCCISLEIPGRRVRLCGDTIGVGMTTRNRGSRQGILWQHVEYVRRLRMWTKKCGSYGCSGGGDWRWSGHDD